MKASVTPHITTRNKGSVLCSPLPVPAPLVQEGGHGQVIARLRQDSAMSVMQALLVLISE